MKKILVVSDLHCGSVHGLLPPGFERTDKKGRLSEARKYLWSAWRSMCGQTEGADIVVVNGDLVDGKQEIQRQTELNLATVNDQTEAAIVSLSQLRPKKGAKWFFTTGSEYHDQKGSPVVEAAAANFKAVQPSETNNVGNNIYSWEMLDLEPELGVVLNIQHSIGVGSGFYRATSYDREGLWSAISGKEKQIPRADAVIRSHAHFFVHLEYPSKHIVGTPCWQLQTRFMRKNSAYRMIPDIGAIVVVVDGQAKRYGRDPIDIHKFLYPLPPRDTVRAY